MSAVCVVQHGAAFAAFRVQGCSHPQSINHHQDPTAALHDQNRTPTPSNSATPKPESAKVKAIQGTEAGNWLAERVRVETRHCWAELVGVVASTAFVAVACQRQITGTLVRIYHHKKAAGIHEQIRTSRGEGGEIRDVVLQASEPSMPSMSAARTLLFMSRALDTPCRALIPTIHHQCNDHLDKTARMPNAGCGRSQARIPKSLSAPDSLRFSGDCAACRFNETLNPKP